MIFAVKTLSFEKFDKKIRVLITYGRVLYRGKYGNYAPLYHAVCKFSYIVRCLQQPT